MRSFSENESRVLQRVAVRCMYEWVTCVAACCSAMHVWMSHVCCSVLQCDACMNESRTTFSSWVDVIDKEIEIFLGEIEPYSLETHLHIWMSHVPQMNESCPTYECIEIFLGEMEFYSFESHLHMSSHTCESVTSHTWLSHVTHMNESRHTYDWVILHIWMSHVTRMNESRHTREWVTLHTWLSHVTHMNESSYTYEWVMSQI